LVSNTPGPVAYSQSLQYLLSCFLLL
jgi:hypothetical protein